MKMGARRTLAGICLFLSAILAVVSMEVLNRSQQMIVVPVICAAMILAFGMTLGSGGRGDGRPAGRRSPDYVVVAAKLDEIEREMKQAGLWQDRPLGPEQYNFTRAFAMDTMSFDQWLQFIFVPKVRGIISARDKFPASSSVGAQAVREFDTYPNAQRLVTLLSEFDSLF
jgi:uncharacterized protein YqcC (DUF446 family)